MTEDELKQAVLCASLAPGEEGHTQLLEDDIDLVCGRVVAVREAGAALRAATEAVAKAHDAVVEAAVAWNGVHATTSGFHALEHLRDRLILLHEAEHAEAEARAKLEALR